MILLRICLLSWFLFGVRSLLFGVQILDCVITRGRRSLSNETGLMNGFQNFLCLIWLERLRKLLSILLVVLSVEAGATVSGLRVWMLLIVQSQTVNWYFIYIGTFGLRVISILVGQYLILLCWEGKCRISINVNLFHFAPLPSGNRSSFEWHITPIHLGQIVQVLLRWTVPERLCILAFHS